MNDPEEMLEILRGVQFLHGISDARLRPIASIASVRDFPAEAVLFREGQRHPEIYLILQGSIALEVRISGPVTRRIQTVGPGELLGWSPLLGQSEITATARTLRPTRAVAIDASQLMALCEHDSRLGFEVMRRTALALSQRLSATRLQLLDVYGSELPTAPPG